MARSLSREGAPAFESPPEWVVRLVHSSTELVGTGTGSACGDLFGFIPIQINRRTLRAYQDALEESGGTIGLVNTTIRDYWFWTPIGVFLCTEVTGTGIRPAPAPPQPSAAPAPAPAPTP